MFISKLDLHVFYFVIIIILLRSLNVTVQEYNVISNFLPVSSMLLNVVYW